MTLTREDRLKMQLTRAMAKRDFLNANYVLEKEVLDEDIAKLQNELDNLETYGDMALVADQTEPKRGEWMFKDDDIFAGEYFCSICNERAEVDLYGEWVLTNFCPNCGADMRKE